MKKAILHATLTSGDLILFASDMSSEKRECGNAVSLMLSCDSEKEIRSLYRKLSKDGQQDQPIETNFWNALSGDLTDKFGNRWHLHYQNTNTITLKHHNA